MSLLVDLSEWFDKRPLVLMRFGDGFEEALLESRRGTDRFTFARPHDTFSDLRLPTLCLAEMVEGEARTCFVGAIMSKSAVTTFDSRVTVVGLQALNLTSLSALRPKLAGHDLRTMLKQRLAARIDVQGLSPKLSAAIMRALANDPEDWEAIRVAATNLPELRRVSPPEWEQLDAIRTAMATFGLSKSEAPESVEIGDGSDSTLKYLGVHALEDNVIARDASIIHGLTMIERHITGRAVFRNRDEQLVVYTANRGPLEAMLGVDLIYVNQTMGNTVMVQYKMLEVYREAGTDTADWVFRPDRQLKDEVTRMKLPPIRGRVDDYRLHPDPFFFKFVQRKGNGQSHASIIISLDHLNQLFASARGSGLRGGVRVSFKALGGAYLRESDFIGLIRSGYIGTHRAASKALHPIISEVAKGNRAIVLAWQKCIEMESEL